MFSRIIPLIWSSMISIDRSVSRDRSSSHEEPFVLFSRSSRFQVSTKPLKHKYSINLRALCLTKFFKQCRFRYAPENSSNSSNVNNLAKPGGNKGPLATSNNSRNRAYCPRYVVEKRVLSGRENTTTAPERKFGNLFENWRSRSVGRFGWYRERRAALRNRRPYEKGRSSSGDSSWYSSWSDVCHKTSLGCRCPIPIVGDSCPSSTATAFGSSSFHLSMERRRAFMKKLPTVVGSRPSCLAIVTCISFDGLLVSWNGISIVSCLVNFINSSDLIFLKVYVV